MEGLTGDDFVADISVARVVSEQPSIDAVRRRIAEFLTSSQTRTLSDQPVEAAGLKGWTWDFPEVPEADPRPRREPYRLVVLYDPRGYEWVLTFSWADSSAREQHSPVFEHALRTFTPK